VTWEAHQARGVFGFGPDKQPRWAFRVNIEEALAESEGFRELFWRWMKWPESPPWSGGVFEWPSREADALAFAKREWRAVQAYLKSLEVK
jgi:hypothetical protein